MQRSNRQPAVRRRNRGDSSESQCRHDGADVGAADDVDVEGDATDPDGARTSGAFAAAAAAAVPRGSAPKAAEEPAAEPL